MKDKMKKAMSTPMELSTYHHAIDVVFEDGHYYLIVVQYNHTGGSVLSKTDLGEVRGVALKKAGFVLGDKVLKGIEMRKEYLTKESK